MKNLINAYVDYKENFSLYIKLAPPLSKDFLMFPGEPPVAPVTLTRDPEKDLNSASKRFQSHMRWQSGLRECMRWIDEVEVEKRIFFDYVIRLREDSFIFRPFYLKPYIYERFPLSSLGVNGMGGINDHTLIVARKFADSLLRGLSEDYYFNLKKSRGSYWLNPETLIRRMASFYGASVKLFSVCEFPFISIHKRENQTHWNFAGDPANNKIRNSYTLKCAQTTEPRSTETFLSKVEFMEPDLKIALQTGYYSSSSSSSSKSNN